MLPLPLHLEPVKEIYEQSLSEGNLKRIQELLEDCNLNHSTCSVTELPTLPTRVVSVGNANTSPKLFCTQGERAEYLALSHCWGTDQNFTTTTATLIERTRGITWTDLPKCFQDTITLARKLGFSYVWIDSLCILQDDRYFPACCQWRRRLTEASQEGLGKRRNEDGHDLRKCLLDCSRFSF